MIAAPAARRGGAAPGLLLGAALLALVLLLGQVLGAGLTRHAVEAHAGEAWNAVAAMEALRRGGCPGAEAYYSEPRATFLVLCPLGPDREGLWGGLFLRPNRAGAGLVAVTAYAAPRARWDRLLRRDGYAPIPLLPAP